MSEMKKVLIISYYFPPLGGVGVQRVLKFCKYLPEFGWQPIVITPQNRTSSFFDLDLKNELSNSVQIIETRAFLPFDWLRRKSGHESNQSAFSPQRKGIRSFFRNLMFTLTCFPDEYWGWIPFAVRAGEKAIREHKINAILSTGPPNSCHLIGRKLSQKTGIPWLTDLRDLWNMYPASYNPFDWQWREKIDNYLEMRILRNAAQILATSEEMTDFLKQEFRQKINVLTNGFDPNDYANSRKLDPDKFVIAHVGSLFLWRTLKPILNALKVNFESEQEFSEKIVLRQIGSGPKEAINSQHVIPSRAGIQADSNGQKKLGSNLRWNDPKTSHQIIELRPFTSHSKSLQEMQNADLLCLIVGDLPNAREMIPAKFFEYLGAKRPMLCIAGDGAVRNLCTKIGIPCFRADETTEIAKEIKSSFRNREQNKSGFEYPHISQFERRFLTQKLAGILDDLNSKQTTE